jgi:hypothetical protein
LRACASYNSTDTAAKSSKSSNNANSEDGYIIRKNGKKTTVSYEPTDGGEEHEFDDDDHLNPDFVIVVGIIIGISALSSGVLLCTRAEAAAEKTKEGAEDPPSKDE